MPAPASVRPAPSGASRSAVDPRVPSATRAWPRQPRLRHLGHRRHHTPRPADPRRRRRRGPHTDDGARAGVLRKLDPVDSSGLTLARPATTLTMSPPPRRAMRATTGSASGGDDIAETTQSSPAPLRAARRHQPDRRDGLRLPPLPWPGGRVYGLNERVSPLRQALCGSVPFSWLSK